MQPLFLRINQSIEYTLEYYTIGRIKDYMFRFARTESVYSTPHHLDSWFEIIFKLHDRMEDEILQTINTTNHNTQVFLFEFLKDWIFDWRIEQVNVGLVIDLIEQYNKKANTDFEIKVNSEVQKFQESADFKREHLEVYEVDIKGLVNMFGSFAIPPYKKKVINYKYYCITEKPELIDTAYLIDYLKIVKQVVDNFRRIITKYISLYDAGKIVPNAQIIIEKLHLPQNENLLSLPDSSNSPFQKLKWIGTAQEFVDFFEPLIYERKIILNSEQKSDTDPIAKLLYSFFEIKKGKGNKKSEITVQTLQTYFKNNSSKRASKSNSNKKK